MTNKEEAPDYLWQEMLDSETDKAEAARSALIVHYQFLVEGLARKLKGTLPSWISDEDLISYGQIGLIKAVDRYLPERGAFRNFASTYVHGAIIDELRSQDWAPRGLRKDQKSIHRASQELKTSTGGAVVTTDDIANHLGWERSKVKDVDRRVQNATHSHMDALAPSIAPSMFGGSGDSTSDEVSANSMLSRFVKVFNSLPPITQLILARRYYLNESLAITAHHAGLTPAFVRQEHTDALSLIHSTMLGMVDA